MLDHWDDALDFHARYEFDAVGNRTKRSLDRDVDGVFDEIAGYSYNAGDQLLEEIIHDAADAVLGRTEFDYSGTQQSEETVFAADDSVDARTTMAYDLQGRLEVSERTIYAGGQPTSVTRSTYNYDATGIRVSALREIDSDADGMFETRTKVEFLIDHANHTGYQQVVRETHFDADTGVAQKTVDYTFGHDELHQTTIIKNPDGSDASVETVFFMHDGHGDVRALLNAAGAIVTLIGVEQLFYYDAYGNLLNITADQAGTTLLHSGEQFDVLTGQQYLRARYYNPATGTFNRLDDFFGNLSDPQSLHKHAFVHGDPIQGSDPTGRSLVQMVIALGSNFITRVSYNAAVLGEAYYIFSAVALYSLYQDSIAVIYGVDTETGDRVTAGGRVLAGTFVLADLVGFGWVKRVFPKNVSFRQLVNWTTELFSEHIADAPATRRAMATALQFSEEIADDGITVAGKGGIGADIVAKLPDGKLVAREVSVFQGNVRNIYSKIIDEADQIGRGMSQVELDDIAVRDVYLQVTEEIASNKDARTRIREAATNAVNVYRQQYDETLRVVVVDPLGNQIAPKYP